MKKRACAWLLALALLSVPAGAAENSPENFIRGKTYENQFSDLTEDHTFYENVSALYEYGLTVGRSDGTYGLTAPMTVGQAVIFAGRIRSLYRAGDPETGPAAYTAAAVALEGAQRVYAPYLWYLQAEGVLDKALDDCLGDIAQRGQVAHILANLLPEEVLPPVNDSLITQAYASRRKITDVTEYTPYYEDILKLYRCGVSVGSDVDGNFLPDAPITRGAAAAMLTRIVDPSLRLTPDWHLPDLYSAEGVELFDLVTAGAHIAAPQTAADYDSTVRYMLSQGENTLSLNLPGGFTLESARETLNAALLAVKRYCEQGYNQAACSYSAAGSMVIQFSSIAAERTEEYRQSALTAAIAVHDQLWEQGVITPGSSQREIAWAYYQWIAANCVYDDAGGDDSLSHLAYNLFETGTAVCDGYTGAYNLLLKLEGIDCYALPNGSHIWTVATLDGETVHIDATWGDQGATAAAEYFAMTPERSYSLHPWPQKNELPHIP